VVKDPGMRRWRWIRALASTALVLTCGAAHAKAPKELPYHIQTSTREVPGSGLRLLCASAEYPAASSDVWEVVTRFQDYRRNLPRVRESEVLKTEGRLTVLRLRVVLPWPLPDLWNELEIVANESKDKLTWRLLRGNINVNEGTLTLTPVGNTIRMEAEARVDPGHMIPQWAVAWGAKKVLPKILHRMGTRIKAHARAAASAEKATKSPIPRIPRYRRLSPD
jgi:hypothetical protein